MNCNKVNISYSDKVIIACIEIKRLYVKILGRNPDLKGLMSYLDHMMLENFSSFDVEQDLLQSKEYKDKIKGVGVN